jgi:hypothetical protein
MHRLLDAAAPPGSLANAATLRSLDTDGLCTCLYALGLRYGSPAGGTPCGDPATVSRFMAAAAQACRAPRSTCCALRFRSGRRRTGGGEARQQQRPAERTPAAPRAARRTPRGRSRGCGTATRACVRACVWCRGGGGGGRERLLTLACVSPTVFTHMCTIDRCLGRQRNRGEQLAAKLAAKCGGSPEGVCQFRRCAAWGACHLN